MEKDQIPSLLLMERAAMAVVKELTGGSYDLQKILIACGMGNNGGDGLAIARRLTEEGCHVEVCMVGALDHLSEEAKVQLERYQAISGKFVTSPVYREYTVIVDAIFGIGCNREITGIAAEVIREINEAEAAVLSVDIPSGISADSGKVCAVAVRASATVTFFTEKLGMILYPGRDFCGKILTADLGIPFDSMEMCQAITYGEEDLLKLPKRKADSHKGTYGKVLVIAGSQKISGAAYLAAAGAYRMGAGLVKLYTPKENQIAMQILLPEALLEVYDRTRPSLKQLKECMEWADVIVIGPGFGTDKIAEKILKYVIGKSGVPLVVDADGLNILAKNKTALWEHQGEVILTPHLQEMARLTGKTKDMVKKDAIGEAKRFAAEYSVTMVLKDTRTIVTEGNDPVYINTSGNSGMATGGSGDVLAGILGGLLAQKLGAYDAARLGVYLHGMAGDAAERKMGPYSMLATDILDGIAEVTRK